MALNELPLSQGQRALWFLQRLRPEAAAWNIAAAARVRSRGRLDPSRLRRAFERLTERHEALRLSFHETPEGPVLRPGGGLDFREEEGADRERLQSEAERPFDLERDPLLRVRLFRTGGNDVILLVIHHLIADLGSLAVLVRELGPLYDGTPQPPPLPSTGRGAPPPSERHWEYWRKKLAGELPVCELPADRPRPAARSFRGGTRTRRIGPALAGRSTLFAFLVAGLDVLLHRASGQTDLLVGSPTSGRLAPELEGTVGYLVNPVVLRSDLSGSPTFGQLLERVRGTILGALRHQEYPFPLLVERLQPDRDPARPPVFQVMLSFQRAHLPGTGDLAAFALGIEGAEVRTGSMILESLPLERRFSQLDLELMAAETSRGLELALTFNGDLFEPATAERFLGHLSTLLEAAAGDPERRISELPLLSPGERQQLTEWNSTAAPLPDRSVPELFEEQAARTPHAMAVDGLTYGELSERSNAVAQALLEDGLQPEEPVAVRLERGAALAVALLGILKAGGVYLPLNPDHPEPRQVRMLELSGARRVLSAGVAACRDRFAGPAVPDLDAAAYLLFTSGSTGDPKAALVPHRGLLNHLLSKVRGLRLSPADRVAQTAPQSFDIHIWQLLAPLLAGAAVEVLPDEVVRDPTRLLAEVDARGITVLQVVPSLLGPILDEVERGGGGAGLRLLVTIGEALPPELARRWLAARPGVPLINNYGPTECSDGVSDAWLVPEEATRTSIGRPIPNLRLHVLSPDLEPQPVGFPGEVCIAGAGVGRGYLGDPARTAALFVPDPFEPDSGGRLYRTGDLGRRRPDGELEVLGRLDHQIKHRGVRIEPGEIEAALVAHPGVREAVVALRDGRLAAWWTGDPGAAPELRDHLRQRLPEAMVPLCFQWLDALPLTPHGKLDRRALPDPTEAPLPASPGDEMEQLLAGIFGEVLGREKVGPRDDFFALGGHSLLATQVGTRVREALGIEPPLSLLFAQPTVAGLAARLRDLPSLPSVRKAAREGRIPLSFAQKRLWFLHQLDPDSPAYNMPGFLQLSGPVDLSAVVARHEVLRTTFPAVDGEPYQEIGPAVPVPIPIVDLSALPDSDGEARRLALEEGRRPFDLARGPLLRALQLRLGHEQRLVVVLHHIVADGWSLEILAREVLAPSSLPLPIQYADYVIWQREQPVQLDWWKNELAGDLAPLELPLDRPRPTRPRHRGARVPVRIPEVQHLRQLARASGATPFMVLLAAFQALLHRLSGQDDVRVGSPVANRRQAELEGLIGCFANPLVLRTRFGSPCGFRELVTTVRATALGAYNHQDVPFERLVEELRSPLFQALLIFQPGATSLEGVEEIDNGTSKLDLALSLRETDDRIEGWIEYDADLFELSTVERWSASLLALLEAGISDPQRPLPELTERRPAVITRTVPALDTVPLGPVEEGIAGIWMQVLGTGGIGRNRSFFDLGGHSLLGVRVMSRLNETFGTALALRDLFDAPTVAGLARLVSKRKTGPPMPELRKIRRGGPLAPSFAQERLWVMHRLTPEPVYNVFQALDLGGPLDEAALERAFSEVARRHETLRTRFATVQGRPIQVVDSHQPRPLPVVDLRGLPSTLRQREADRLAGEEARRPFDLERGPLLRVTVLRPERLLVTLHHIVCDGWSFDLLAREVEALYRGQPLPELPFQYADYADWQRRWPAELLDGQLAWWTDRLAGLANLELPTDRPRPPVQSFRGAVVTAVLPLSDGLRELARERHATLFMVLLAGWQVLLHRLTGQTDVAVGSPVANRSRPELEDLIGFFVNNLVLRVDLSGEPTFSEALVRVREAVLSAHAHQDLPFERLVAERDPSRSPLFQVAFSFEEAMHGRSVDVHTGTSRLDLWLQVEPESARAEYATALFDAATVRRWLGHLRVLLEGIAASPETRISELPLLTPEEIEELTAWNRTAAEVPQEPVHHLFRRWAEHAPDALAISWQGGQLTYGELARRVDRLASGLRAQGVGPETVVALRMERSPDLVAAVLAVLEAGGAYLPIDPANPEDRVRWILEDSGAMEWTAKEAEPGEGGTSDPDALAYVIYTSGSTGTPKGTELRHRGLSNLIAWHCRAHGLEPSDRTALLASPGVDVSVCEIWSALASGASLHVPPPDKILSPPTLLAWMAKQRITVSSLPTPLAEAVLAEPLPEGLALRALLTGGDRLRLRPAPGLPFDLINLYGLTESTVDATSSRVAPEGERAPDIGSPIANTRVHVLDCNFRLVPVGIAGELCLAGEGLARAYRGRPELTAERFVPNPFGEGERLYRTGDLARWLPGGNLQFLGRIDHQVKIRGFRVELGEIEAVLRQCPGVREAAAVVREDRLTGYYVPEPGSDPSPDRLREELRRKLPEVMVPAAFVPLEAMPLAAGGKIDRRALPAPPPWPVAPAAAPRTPLESLVAGVFGEVLGVDEVPRNVSFFDLGGNSLMATQVVTLIQDVLPVELDLRTVFEGPTVARIAEVLEEERGTLATPEQLAVTEILAELERSLAPG